MSAGSSFSSEDFPRSIVGLFGLVLLLGGLFLGGMIYLWIVGPDELPSTQNWEVDEVTVIKWMESSVRAEQAFELAWQKNPDDPNVYVELERAIDIQAKLRALDSDNSFGSASRYEKLIDRFDQTKGKSMHLKARALSSEASRLVKEGNSFLAIELLEEALAAQEWINQHLYTSNLVDVGEVSRIRQMLGNLKSEETAKKIDLLAGGGGEAFEQRHWDKAEEHWSQALALQESINFHTPESRHARWRLVQEIRKHLQRIEAARLNDQIESLLDAGGGGESVDVLERAFNLQVSVNERFPSTEFNRPDRLEDLRKRMLIGQSSAQAASISQQTRTLDGYLRAGEWDMASSSLLELEESVQSFQTSFPVSLLQDSVLPERIQWLLQRQAEIPSLVAEVQNRLVNHPRIPGLRVFASEVDQALFDRVMGKNPSRWEGDDLPVDSVAFDLAKVFCDRLSWMMGQPVKLPYVQWLLIAELQPGQKEDLWLSHSTQFRSRPVGSSRPVGGLFDLYGNIEEWVLDLDQGERVGLFGGSGTNKFDTVIREPARWVAPNYRSRWAGFRFCVLSPEFYINDR